jgi:ABC-type glycerol-3-phosphate transport system substrate-binding protein
MKVSFFPTNSPVPSASSELDIQKTPLELTRIVPSTVTQQPVKSIGVPLSELRGVIIHFWHGWSGLSGDLIQYLVEYFNLHNEWGVIVVPIRQATLDEMAANFEEVINTSNEPDLVVAYPSQYLKWDEDIGLVDLYPYVSDPAWGLNQDEQDDFYPIVWEQDVLDGKRLGMPAQRSAQVLFYNETWARSLGFSTPPATPEQFIEQACASARQIRESAVDNPLQAVSHQPTSGMGGWIISANYAAMLGWIYSFGGEVIHIPEPGLGQTVYQFNNPQVEETFTFLRGLYDQLCAWQPDSQFPAEEFASRKGLFFTGSVTDIPDLAIAFDEAGNNDRWTVIPFPSQSAHPAVDVYGSSFVLLPSTPQRQLAAWLFVKWLLSPVNQALLLEKTSALPLRTSSIDHLKTFQNRYPQWVSALELLPQGRSEPLYRSWNTVRWALSDASTQLFRDYFTIDQVPVLLDYLDYTAAELHLGLEPNGSLATPTPSPVLTFTPTISKIPSLTSAVSRTP